MNSFVKVCGITSAADASQAVAAGVDAVGVVLTESSRRVSPDVASEIFSVVNDQEKVAVIRGIDEPTIVAFAERSQCSMVQLYDEPSELLVRELLDRSVRIIGAVSNDSSWPYAEWMLLDGVQPGSGLLHEGSYSGTKPWILAGGLSPENVASQIVLRRPCGVDVSSGVERAPGLKDAEKVAAFVSAARRAFEEMK
jgi:phosphoribosylanthranilate isomerase